MNLATGDISLDEILKLYDIIKNHFQKGKNDVCLGLEVLLTNVQDWYKDNSKMSERLIDRDDITYGYFHRYTNKDERAWVARESIRFIEEDLAPYVEDELNGNSKGNLKDKLIGKLTRKDEAPRIEDERPKRLGEVTGIFINDAIESKKLMLLENKDRVSEPIVVSLDMVDSWIKGLLDSKKEIEGLVSSLRRDLECGPTMDQNLIERIRDYILDANNR